MIANPVLKNIDSSSLPLSTGEEMRLTHLEKTVTDQKQNVAKAFVEIGKALSEIRDDKLYRVQFDSFEVYVERRFKISRARAYQMISANDVATSLAGILEIKNEVIAREISRAPKSERKEVGEKLAKIAKKKPITQQTAREVVEQIQSKPRGGIAAMLAESKEQMSTARRHVGPAKTLDIVKTDSANPGKIIADWWASNRSRLLSYPATPTDEIVNQIIGLFA